MRYSIFSFLFLIFFSLGFQARAFDIPPLTGPVVDQAGLLSPVTRQKLSQALAQAHQNKGPQIQVLIVSSLQGLSIEEAAIKVFDQWKLGSEKEDNGVLFIIAPKEKRLRIEVGRGLEGDIPDAIAKRVVSDVVRPFFKRGDYNGGVVQGVQSILYYSKAQVTLNDISAEPQSVSSGEDSGVSGWMIFIVIGLWILLFMFNPSLALAILFSGRGGRGGGGSGGGSWSGGGGSSAGGGASGDW